MAAITPELQRVQDELKTLLADAVRVLEQNRIPYCAICGTLLGAVRHHGFIPWDDDVDLLLTRRSYEAFAAVYPAQCAPGFALDLTDTWVPRVRRAGGGEWAFVDLFILDPLPDGRLARSWKLLRLKTMQGMLKKHADYSRFSLSKRALLRVTHAMGRLQSREKTLAAYRRVARGGKGARVHMSDGAFNLLSMPFDEALFASPQPIAFEDLTVRAPKDAAAVLTLLYGPDYMTPPPPAQRKPVHLDV
ncbi:MAG: LicD family protein [Eubacteriales bacterium]|nr:LicD family protein [Eubacteriales bacterium]